MRGSVLAVMVIQIVLGIGVGLAAANLFFLWLTPYLFPEHLNRRRARLYCWAVITLYAAWMVALFTVIKIH